MPRKPKAAHDPGPCPAHICIEMVKVFGDCRAYCPHGRDSFPRVNFPERPGLLGGLDE